MLPLGGKPHVWTSATLLPGPGSTWHAVRAPETHVATVKVPLAHAMGSNVTGASVLLHGELLLSHEPASLAQVNTELSVCMAIAVTPGRGQPQNNFGSSSPICETKL